MKKIKVGIVQPRIPAHREKNLQRLCDAVGRLAAQGAQLVVLPELQSGPYFCQTEDVENFDLAETIPGPTTERLSAAALGGKCVVVATVFERRAPGLYHNTAVVIEADGSIAGKYRKMHIPDDPCYYEKFYFTPGDIGFRPISTSLGKLGVQICWDQWYPEGARLMALAGAQILIYPTAIGAACGDTPQEVARQREAWITVQRGHAVANGVYLVAVNRTGHEDDPSHTTSGIDFWGSSFVCGPQGEFLAECSREEEDEAVVEIDLQHAEHVRRWWPFLRDRRIDSYSALTERFLDGNS
jgi:N-carbamoylputrescine amidase